MNTLVADATTHRPTPAFLTIGFRPFFLAAGLWSASAPPRVLWIVIFATGGTLPSRFDPRLELPDLPGGSGGAIAPRVGVPISTSRCGALYRPLQPPLARPQTGRGFCFCAVLGWQREPCGGLPRPVEPACCCRAGVGRASLAPVLSRQPRQRPFPGGGASFCRTRADRPYFRHGRYGLHCYWPGLALAIKL